jgi:hypothetical protein
MAVLNIVWSQNVSDVWFILLTVVAFGVITLIGKWAEKL